MGIQTALLLTAAGGAVGEVSARGAEVRAQEEQIRRQQTQRRIAFEEAQIQRRQELNNVLSNQLVSNAARGVSSASPTFKAIQKKAFDAFDADTRAASLNLSFEESRSLAELQELQRQRRFGNIATAMNFGTGFFQSLRLSRLQRRLDRR